LEKIHRREKLEADAAGADKTEDEGRADILEKYNERYDSEFLIPI
jgi:hypothetical protein